MYLKLCYGCRLFDAFSILWIWVYFYSEYSWVSSNALLIIWKKKLRYIGIFLWMMKRKLYGSNIDTLRFHFPTLNSNSTCSYSKPFWQHKKVKIARAILWFRLHCTYMHFGINTWGKYWNTVIIKKHLLNESYTDNIN